MTALLLDRRPGALRPLTRPDERAARRALQDQIARLEWERAGLFTSAWPRTDVLPPPGPSAARGARLPSLGELEEARDELVAGIAAAQRALAERTAAEEQNRRLLEEMLLEPERHGGLRLTNADLGEPGCTTYVAEPSAGLLGRLMRWWRVRISSGCPLAPVVPLR